MLKSELQTNKVSMCASAKSRRLLIADDDPITQRVIRHGFESVGLNADYYQNGDALLADLSDGVEACVLDIQMPGSNGLECLQRIKKEHPHVEVIILTSVNQAAAALEAVRLGAFDYITKPFDLKELRNRVSNAMAYSRSQLERRTLRDSLSEPQLETRVLGQSPVMQQVQALVERIAPTANSVLLTGSSGTGKTLLARSIHAASKRADGPFISVSCPSLPGELLESEMFGHEKGAFTGATARRIGRAQLAEGGTLFLDEIGELSLPLQAKLLTFLQSKTYYRIGGEKALQSDVRILAATNQDLEARVQAGLFREDLFYRLNVLPIQMPNLAERRADIPMLVEQFVGRIASENEQAMPVITPECLLKLQQMPWPGNVRELENAVIRAMALRTDPEQLQVDDLIGLAAPQSAAVGGSLGGMTLAEIERRALVDTLELCGQRKAEAARMLGIAEKSVYNKMRRHGLIED
ncbi:MAG: sigma-54-dependent transcriptional regulator [Coraliomargarita sp.]